MFNDFGSAFDFYWRNARNDRTNTKMHKSRLRQRLGHSEKVIALRRKKNKNARKCKKKRK